MSKLLRGLAAGAGARYLGGRMGCGCFGTVIIFAILWWLLGGIRMFQ